ncbi:MAG: methionyl-tRNA formyltransferase [Parcubacteria group bacterium]
MNFVFFGTPRFAAIVLGRLIEGGLSPLAIVTNPDRPVGRKKVITSPAAKITSQKLNPRIPVLQPEKINEEFLARLREFNADFFLVAAYGKILPKELIDIPRYGTIGVHPSLLPKLRGTTPIQSAILNGLKETGATLYLIDEKMDHGPIILSRSLVIHSEDNTESLGDRLAILGSDMVKEIIPSISSSLKLESQKETEATFTKKITTDDAYVSPKELESAEAGENDLPNIIERKIRAYTPEPGCWTVKNGKRVKLLDAEIIESKLIIKSIQVEGKKPIIIR